MIKNSVFFLLVMATFNWSCKKDDGSDIVVVPPRPLGEVKVEDEVKIKEYLQTHFYNYEDFEIPPTDFDYKIVLDTIAGDNAGKTPLIDQMTPKTIKISSSYLGLSTDEKDIEHTYYYLSARDGIGDKLSVADSAYVRYEGSLLNGTVFDGTSNIPVWFDLIGAVRGFGAGTSQFSGGGVPIVNDDGTFSVDGYGVGLIIFPSGLGYYNVARTGIPAYSPMIFKVDLFAINQTDHDRDGIPSILEDLNGDGYLYNDNTDEAQESANRSTLYANFIDADDDGDGVPTIEEIVVDDQGNITYPDSDSDGTPDYLDSDS